MTNITTEELKARLDAGETLNLVYVREPHEVQEFNIGGQAIPLGKIQTMQAEELDELRDEEVIFYCRSGNRSGQACLILQALGFSNVKNLVGGMLDWQAKYPAQ